MSGRRGPVLKKGQVALQTEVNTEDDWTKLLEKEGLVVVDVYSGWCGPCVGMVSYLKKLKIEIGNDNFRLAVAKSDGIGALKRFANKSEPTWMFIANGRLVNLMFGADAARLRRLIREELELEASATRGERERSWTQFDELTQEEKARLEKTREREEAERKREAAALAGRLAEIETRNLQRFAKIMRDRSVVVYFPHTIDEQGVCEPALRMLARYDGTPLSVHDQTEVQLSEDTLAAVFRGSPPPPDAVRAALLAGRPCLASLVACRFPKRAARPPRLGAVEKRVATFVCGHATREPPAPGSPASDFLQQTAEGEEPLPAVWTPIGFLAKASAVMALFPHLLVTSGFRLEKLPPPRYCVILEASKAKEASNAVAAHPEDVLNVGFFDGVDPATARAVAGSAQELEALGPDDLKRAKMVLAVSAENVDPLIVFVQFSPVYVSTNTKIGESDCDLFFPAVDELEGEDVVGAEGPDADKAEEEAEAEEAEADGEEQGGEDNEKNTS